MIKIDRMSSMPLGFRPAEVAQPILRASAKPESTEAQSPLGAFIAALRKGCRKNALATTEESAGHDREVVQARLVEITGVVATILTLKKEEILHSLPSDFPEQEINLFLQKLACRVVGRFSLEETKKLLLSASEDELVLDDRRVITLAIELLPALTQEFQPPPRKLD